MSASTVPAAVPEPNNNPGTTTGTTPQNTPSPGLFASMVAPVEPARPTFDLTPATVGQADTGGGTGLPTEGVSSASFNNENSTPKGASSDAKDTGSSKQQTGIWRAWLVAGATRWGRGGGTANKRLDMRKARAQAQQVKETRTVTVNRSPAGGAGGRGSDASGPAGGKGLSSKGRADGATKGTQKNTGPGAKDNSRQGPAGRSGNTGPGPSGRGNAGGGGGAAGTKNGPIPKQPKPAKPDTTAPKQPKSSNGTDVKNGKSTSSTGGKGGAKGSAGTAGKAGKDGASPKPSAATKDPAKAAAKEAKDSPAPKDRKKLSLIKDTKTAKTNDKTSSGTDTGAGEKPGTSKDKPADKPATDEKATPDGKKKIDTPAGEKTTTTDGKPFTTKPSRETGYRDGTRAARATAHAKAYRDGVKDGWADTIEAADREKTRLDQAHQDRKNARQETPVTTATSADHQNTDPTPIEVQSVSKTHVLLGDGSSRASMTRGEVRSLKGFERRLEERATTLANRAEQTRGLKAHAEEQAMQATRLLDAARSAEAGDKYIGTLTRLQEAAKGQAVKADEIHKQSMRGAEHCRTTLANVQTRYGGIYQAVVDSPETSPAELDFYQG
ncbi:hypothetical protein [Streptomyces sp. NPDC058092]|uniref:hypothetical protein n=1 Tax=Streptomyces sp. NPDC058092 TaxID=3346336 RepID=UPI0036EBBA6A